MKGRPRERNDRGRSEGRSEGKGVRIGGGSEGGCNAAQQIKKESDKVINK